MPNGPIVDDEKSIREALAEFPRCDGYDAVAACSHVVKNEKFMLEWNAAGIG